jgi:Fur family transcriptional regulator, ferric uptake regulator
MKAFINFKKTPSRLAILSVLKKNKPLDVLQIFELVKGGTDLATVYRTLDTFCGLGLINRLEFGEGKYRYEIKNKDHHHLICKNCKKIDEIDDNFMQNWEKDIKKKRGFLVNSHALEFFGLCKECQ